MSEVRKFVPLASPTGEYPVDGHVQAAYLELKKYSIKLRNRAIESLRAETGDPDYEPTWEAQAARCRTLLENS